MGHCERRKQLQQAHRWKYKLELQSTSLCLKIAMNFIRTGSKSIVQASKFAAQRPAFRGMATIKESTIHITFVDREVSFAKFNVLLRFININWFHDAFIFF
jgi:hypothetical protein